MDNGALLTITRGTFVMLLFLSVVSASVALSVAAFQLFSYAPHAPIIIQSNAGFVPSNGVTGGTGTGSDPFIIQGWNINASGGNGVTIIGTTAYFVVRDVSVHSGVRGFFFQNVQDGVATSSVLTNNQNPVIIDHSTNFAFNGTTISNSALANSAVSITNSTNVSVSAITISGRTFGSGITVNYSTNVKIIASQISSYYWGIATRYSSMITVSRNNGSSIYFSMSGNSTVAGNNVTGIFAEFSVTISIIGNTIHGGSVDLTSSSYSTISNNVFRGGGLIIGSDPGTHTVLPNNSVNGKPLYYYKDCTGTSVDAVLVGQLIMVGCQGVRIANLQIANTTDAIYLAQVQGVLLLNNKIANNTMGMRIDSSSYLTIVGNTFKSNGFGMSFGETSIPQRQSVGNSFLTISGNNLVRNQCGICGLDTVSNANVYHNNFVNNTAGQVNGYGILILDNGYPSGGNYWSDYTGVDNCGGPSQNICPQPDGIGDTPYIGSNGLKDRYPLMKPYSAPADTSAPSWPTNSVLVTSGVDSTSVSLSWPNATDDAEVIVYRIYMGATVVGYVPGHYHSYTVAGLSPGTTYTFRIDAGDAADNWSQNGLSTTLTTPNPVLNILLVSLGLAGASIILLIWWLRRRQHLKTEASPVLTKEGSVPGQFFGPTNRRVEFTRPSVARTRLIFSPTFGRQVGLPRQHFQSF